MDMNERNLKRVERLFNRGKDTFMARGIMASIALGLSDDMQSATIASNEGIMKLLDQKGAQAEVFAIRRDLGNGDEDSSDIVRVIARDGVATSAVRNAQGEQVVIRATTDEINS